jgi:dipeptidyl aminopeptidase/acylaminoacyl peptidase
VNAFVAVVLLCIAGMAHAQDVTPGRLVMLRRMTDPNLSRDGALAAYTLDEAADSLRGSEDSYIWIKTTRAKDAPRRLAAAVEGDYMARFSPVSGEIAFLSARASGAPGVKDGTTQIYVAASIGDTARRITASRNSVQRYRWSADGRSIAYITSDTVMPTSHYAASDIIHADWIIRNQLWIVDVASGSERRVTNGEFDVREAAWSPDGTMFAAIIAPSPGPNDDIRARLVVLDAATGAVLRTLDERIRGVTRVLRWSPDGKWITFFQDSPTRRSFWLAVVPAEGGAVVPVLKDFPGTVMQIEWQREPNHLAMIMLEGTTTHLWDVDVRSGAHSRIADVLASQSSWGLSSNGTAILYMSETAAAPSDLWFTESGTAVQLTDHNPEMKSWRLGEVRTVRWKNRDDGLSLEGVVVLPVGYVQGRRYPTIVHMHPSDLPWWPGWIGSWWAWGQLLAAHGYVVFMPNYRGVNGYGWRSRETLDDWGGAAMQDMLDGVDKLIADGIADPDRLGVGGWSNGGFMTEWTITHTNRFKAAVAEAAHADWFTMYGSASTGWLGLKETFGTDPYTDRTPYDAHSPVRFVKNARTPTLLLHGQSDGSVPVGQAWEFYRGLKENGVEAQLMIFPNEGHGIGRSAHRTELQTRVLDWFDRFLK